MRTSLHLHIATPAEVLVDDGAVRAVRAMDRSGSFGILPGHTDMLTVLPASVLEWVDASETRQFCAVRNGVLTVGEGENVTVASRHAVRGATLEELASIIEEARSAEVEADRKARVEQVRFHAQAVRHLVRYLMPRSSRGMMPGLPGKDWP